ncbi:MAG: DM13 domain-containing protein [bacterium]|nr:DM13 domain-containing protein [bacterium]
MKKLLVGIGIVAALGVAYWLVSPLFITERVDEKLEDIMAATPPAGAPPAIPPASSGENTATPSPPPAAPEVISQGMFTGLAGHSGRGTAKLLSIDGKYFIRLEDDFRVTNGPDLFVYFGKNGAYAAEARLGSLKGNEGGQNYEVPAGIDPESYDEVWIWCHAFSVPFARAELR